VADAGNALQQARTPADHDIDGSFEMKQVDHGVITLWQAASLHKMIRLGHKT
jgi:hypothetical protein